MLAHNVHDVQMLQAPRPCQPAERHRQRVADAGAGQGVLPAAQHRARRCAIPVLGAALQRRGGTARHDAVAWGYARAADALRRRHHPELRGHRHPPRRRRRGRRRRDDARASSRAQQGRRRRGRPHQRGHGDGRRAHAARELSAAGAGVRAGEAGLPLRRDVEHGPRLHQPVRQGRAGDRRRHRRSTSPTASAAACTSSSTRWRRSASCSRCSAACACCATGAASSTSRPTARRSSARRRCRASTSIAAGAPAASRRRRARATSSPTPSRTDEPHPINAPFTLDRFRTGRLIDEAAAAAVAH